MVTWPIGLSTGCFYQHSIFSCLERIRESGFSMVEVCFSPTHLDYQDHAAVHRAAHHIDELGMEAYSFHAPFAGQLDISSPEETVRHQALKEILKAVEAAAILQVHYFVIHPGPETSFCPSPQERFERMESLVRSLDQIAESCRSQGICCLLENKLPHLLFGKSSDVLWILDALDSTDVGVCLDTGHAALSGDLPGLMHKLGSHLRMVHAHDNRGDRDDHLAPGDGHIDWEMVIRSLQTSAFQGAIILELAGISDPSATMATARRGRKFLRRLCRKVALART